MPETRPHPTRELDTVEPRDQTQHEFEEHHELLADHDPVVEPTTLDHNGNTLEATFTCQDCRVSFTEVYLLRYIERRTDGTRWARNETPTCDCDKSTEHGDSFQETSRTKRSNGTAVAVGRCGYCGTVYDDVYKYQHTR